MQGTEEAAALQNQGPLTEGHSVQPTRGSTGKPVAHTRFSPAVSVQPRLEHEPTGTSAFPENRPFPAPHPLLPTPLQSAPYSTMELTRRREYDAPG